MNNHLALVQREHEPSSACIFINFLNYQGGDQFFVVKYNGKREDVVYQVIKKVIFSLPLCRWNTLVYMEKEMEEV